MPVEMKERTLVYRIMIKSMTGFGRSEKTTKECKITVEMKAVNHRYCDLSIRLPKKFNYFEAGIRTVLKEYIERTDKDTIEGTLNIIEQHFGLSPQSVYIKKENLIDRIVIRKVDKDTELVNKLLDFVGNFSWEEVKEHTLWMLRI